ncbi:MAG TPA: Fic/DOC family N-terminal domain-containing protein [Thermoanaerobaculia bacterium]|nr:Fic/DOC family N-terminal domain-containing protein [Thermoanaerobaculia bacterium]
MPPRPRAPGRSLRSPEGYPAFLPDPLPPELVWTPGLLRTLSDADRALGKLAGQGGWLPNPHLLIRPFLRREAVLSSRIEGTQATLGELLAAEAGAAVDRSPADLREVANYVVALEYGIARLRELPLSLRLVRELHARLMAGVRGGQATLGEFRRSQNWIGPAGSRPEEASYVPPPPVEMLEALSSWESFLHDGTLPPLVQIALAHYQFEAIHPFLDGNGRVGRLLIVLAFVERSLLPSPLLYLSAFFEATRQEYYDRLRGVSVRGEWEEWVQYFLSGVARQAEDAVRRIERVETLLAAWRDTGSDSSGRVAALVDLLAENPFWTIRRVADRLGVVYTTAQRAVGRLEAAGILTQVGDARRDRLYCAQALLAILEEPASLTPEL